LLRDDNAVRAAGVIVPETKFAATDQDALTGLLDRRSFVARAREMRASSRLLISASFIGVSLM